jgi:hypothetical protein
MARLIFMAIDCKPAHKEHRAYKRGDLIDILRDDQFCGIEVTARSMFRSVRVPLATRERFEYLLEADPFVPGSGNHKRRSGVNLDALEAIGRRRKGGELDAMDEIEIVDPKVIDAAVWAKSPAANKLVIG